MIDKEKLMNFRQKITFSILPTLVLGSVAFAQVVEIPDPNLRAAIRETLKLSEGVITEADMKRLTHLGAYNMGIADLSGLEMAMMLKHLGAGRNPIKDLRPLAQLTNLKGLVMPDCNIKDLSPLSQLMLEELNLRGNPISDLLPLANVISLKYLDLSSCLISDLTPLSSLVNLHTLQVNNNDIEDVTSISMLPGLRKLEIEHNPITDYSPLASLLLDERYYQECNMPALLLGARLRNRSFPSIIARWSTIAAPPVENRPELSGIENMALHDLRFSGQAFGLRISDVDGRFRIAGPLEDAVRIRDEMLAINPNMINLFDVGMRAAPIDWFPENWPYWIKDEQGNTFREVSHDGYATVQPWGLLDFTHPHIQERIVQQAVAVSQCGLFDGIFFDFWADTIPVLGGFDGARNYFPYTLADEQRARDTIIRGIRAQTPPEFLIMGNVGSYTIPLTGAHMNGGFMESGMPHGSTGEGIEEKVELVENTLAWLANNLREPRINALEGWSIPGEPPDSPENRRWMRVTTTMALTHSDGYVVFTNSSNHDHYWYDFWDADLGRPVGEKRKLYQETDGLYIREFTNGWAVYNHSGETQEIMLPEFVTGVASGMEGTTHTLPNLDGEMYLRAKPANPADVNGDGAVNILDLTIVAQAFGTGNAQGDVNGDGVINVFDLVFVAEQF